MEICISYLTCKEENTKSRATTKMITKPPSEERVPGRPFDLLSTCRSLGVQVGEWAELLCFLEDRKERNSVRKSRRRKRREDSGYCREEEREPLNTHAREHVHIHTRARQTHTCEHVHIHTRTRSNTYSPFGILLRCGKCSEIPSPSPYQIFSEVSTAHSYSSCEWVLWVYLGFISTVAVSKNREISKWRIWRMRK